MHIFFCFFKIVAFAFSIVYCLRYFWFMRIRTGFRTNEQTIIIMWIFRAQFHLFFQCRQPFPHQMDILQNYPVAFVRGKFYGFFRYGFLTLTQWHIMEISSSKSETQLHSQFFDVLNFYRCRYCTYIFHVITLIFITCFCITH